MPIMIRCPNGHEWEQANSSACPECGASGLGVASSSIADSSAATLPPPSRIVSPKADASSETLAPGSLAPVAQSAVADAMTPPAPPINGGTVRGSALETLPPPPKTARPLSKPAFAPSSDGDATIPQGPREPGTVPIAPPPPSVYPGSAIANDPTIPLGPYARRAPAPAEASDETLAPSQRGPSPPPGSLGGATHLPAAPGQRTEQVAPVVGMGVTHGAQHDQAPKTIPAVPVHTSGPSIPGYKILGELGRGGMGVVYKALDVRLNRLVALKMILSGSYAEESDIIRFRLEAEAVAKLQHPCIVAVYEINECEGKPYFSLEFVDGGPLDKLLAKNLLPPRKAAEMLQKLAQAMDYAHQRNIIHRDLKPPNVLLMADGTPKITDFGLAKKIDEKENSQTQAGSVMGTPSYMAPEQAEGKTDIIGPCSDTYSLGAVLYEFLTGRPPFKGATVLDTLEQVRSQEPVPPSRLQPKVPRDLETICLKCLQKDPKNRYETAGALAEDVGRYLAGEPIHARPTPAYERAWKWTRRNKALSGMIAAAALLVIGLIGGSFIYARLESAHAAKEKNLREVAESERDRAEQNYQEARSAVGEITQVGHRRLAAVPHLEGVRRELLEKALAFNERFLSINGERPEQRLEVARAQLRVGEIQEMLGRPAAAETAYRHALTRFAALEQETPDNVEIRHDLAMTWSDFAILQQAMNQTDEAEKSYEQAITLRTRLASEAPDRPDYQRDLAASHTGRGHLRLATKRTTEAEQDYCQAEGLLQPLPRELALEDLARVQSSLATVHTVAHPARATQQYALAIQSWTTLSEQSAEPRFRHELATVYSNRGALAQMQNQSKQAESDFEEARRLLVQLTGEFRGAVSHREMLANVYVNFGLVLKGQNRQREAEKVWRASVPLWRRLVEDFPDRPVYRFKLAQSCNELGLALAVTNRFDEVDTLWQEALGLQEKLVAEQPRDAACWQEYVNSAMNLVMLNKALQRTQRLEPECRRLVDLQERRSKAFPDVAAYKNDLGLAYYLLAAALVEKKPDEAVAVLQKAAAMGLRDTNALKAKPEWQPLRGRADFKQLIDGKLPSS